MSRFTATAKEQAALRKDLSKHPGAQSGQKIAVDKLSGRIFDAFDFLKRENGPSFPIEEMNEIAARGWTGKR